MAFLILFISCLACLGVLTYVLFFFGMSVGLVLLKQRKRADGPYPSFSIVIPAHNEEPVLAETLAALRSQDYPGDFEVIVVDDRSHDGTATIVQEVSRIDSRFRLVQVSADEPNVASPKKRALARGFEASRHEILASTDADCRPSRGWISALSSRFLPQVGIVQGPKTLSGLSSLCHHYQQCETLALVGVEAAGFGLGHPLLASAPSLAYRRELFEKAGGFQGLEHLESGDDDMLVHRMSRLPGVKVTYCLDKAACVSTPAADSWREVLNQRARWASNGTAYENKAYVAVLSAIFFSWVFLLLGWIPAAAGFPLWKTWIACWIAKIAIDVIYYSLAAWRLKRLSCLLWYPVFAVPQLAIGVWASIAGHFGWYHWNARPT